MATVSNLAARAARRGWGTRRGGVRYFTVLLAALLLTYAGLSAYMADRLSRPARTPVIGTPADYGLAYTDVTFPSAEDAVPLKGWLIDSPGTATILLLHGKDTNRSDVGIGTLAVAQQLVAHNYDVLAFDFRAHGESGGEHYSLGGLETRDVAGAVAYLQAHGRTTIGVIGWSMGAATVLLAAPDQPALRAIVSDSAFADMSLLLEKQLWQVSPVMQFFRPGATFAARTLYNIDIDHTRPDQAVARLGPRPLFLIHGTADTLVPVAHAHLLEAAAAGNPHFQSWILPGVEHVQAFHTAPGEYMQRVLTFFDQNLR
jgi:fermentation-respiration switch protein FrsA (DUF1100 family)